MIMAQNAKGPAEAATSPDRGSNIPQKETKMNTETDTTETSPTPVLQRRKFLALAAAGSAILPAVAQGAAADKTGRLPQAEELPIDRFERHAAEISDTLNEYLNGRFYACIYPSQDYDNPVWLKSIAAEKRPLPDRFESAVSALKAVLAEMHPEATEVRHLYTPRNGGRAYGFRIDAVAAPLAKWDGDGEYQVEGWDEGLAGVYHISRLWSDMDKAWLLFGAYIFEGHRVAPRVIVDPSLILRKVGEVFA